MTLPSPDRLAAIYTLCGLLALWVGWLKVARPKWRRFRDRVSGTLDSIAGREPIVDKSSGRELAPRMPPIGEHLANINDRLNQLSDVRGTLDNHEGRLQALEDSRVEKIVSAAERAATAASSAEMLRLVSEHGTVDGESHEAGELE